MLGASLSLFIIIAVIACNVGQGRQLFGFIDAVPGRDKTGHFLLMGALSFAMVLMLVPRMKPTRIKSAIIVIVVVSLIVSAEEFSQNFVSSRTFSVADLLCSLAGILVFGVLAMLFLPRRSANQKEPSMDRGRD